MKLKVLIRPETVGGYSVGPLEITGDWNRFATPFAHFGCRLRVKLEICE